MIELKKTLTVGAEFTILDSHRVETIGQVRRVNYANTQGVYTIIPAEPDSTISKSNGGRGSYLEWRAAKYWRFKEENVVALYNSAEEQTRETLVIEFRILGGN
jgi:hypothetical protein